MLQKNMSERKRFSLIKRAQSFTHAGRGIVVYLKGTHNAWIHLAGLVIGVLLGWYFHITSTEWMFLVLCSGFVIVTEAINTAIEIDIDLTSPDYHPYAKDTKDVAAGAVLIAAITAVIVGAIIFVPYIVSLLK